VKTVRGALTPHGGRVRVFFMDEARFGQQGTTTRVWARRGSRPTAVKQTRYEWVYLYAAVEPATGASVALQAPHVNTGTMNVFLEMLSETLDGRDHAVLIMDQAGWHKARALVVPDNVTVLYLPPYSPELNPVERLWAYLRSRFLSNRVFDDYQHLLNGGAEAWQQLTPERLRSVCACTYLIRLRVQRRARTAHVGGCAMGEDVG
jgi:transposase